MLTDDNAADRVPGRREPNKHRVSPAKGGV